MNTDNFDAKRKVKQAITNLILDQPFFGALAMRLRVREANGETKTAATDGTTLVYNPEFIDTLTTSQTTGLFVHEILHAANGHCWRRQGRDPETWNKACDYAINPIVLDAGFYLPPDPCMDEAFRGKSAEAIYDRIKQTPPPEDGNGQNPGDQPGTGWGDVMDNIEPDANAQEAEWKVAVITAAAIAKQQGKLPAGLERLLDEIKHPAVDWRSALRRFVQETAKADYTWRRPNPRYMASGMYLPSMRSEQMPGMVVAVDTSGSIGQQELDQFASEIQSIVDECKPESLTVIYCDAAVKATQVFWPEDLVKLNALGGGGTDFAPVFKKIEEDNIETACLVYLTDMYGSFPKDAPPYPVLWVSTSHIKDAPFGEVLSFPREW